MKMERIKKLTAYSREQIQFHMSRKQRFLNLACTTSVLFCMACLVAGFGFYDVYPSIMIGYVSNGQEQNRSSSIVQPKNGSENCDLFRGIWIQDSRGPLYTNYSCTTMQAYKNCFLHGRKDTDFLHWRWKPDQCELPRFDPADFLTTLRGKTMAFIGDSVARNQMESLLCLLSTAETPAEAYKNAEDRFVTWEFPKHNFTLKVFWSPFLVTSTEQTINGSKADIYDLDLDKIDTTWFQKLPSVDYVIISAGHWFNKPSYLYEGGNIIACTYCSSPNVTSLGPGPAIRKAVRATLNAINSCENCGHVHVLLRTFSPAHFEGGAWNEGGRCNKTRPYVKEEISNWGEMELRNVQMEEFEIARNETGGNGNKMKAIDVTEMMLMRADGHPGEFYGGNWMSGYKDCVHWCLPGPVDTWNELLFEVVKS